MKLKKAFLTATLFAASAIPAFAQYVGKIDRVDKEGKVLQTIELKQTPRKSSITKKYDMGLQQMTLGEGEKALVTSNGTADFTLPEPGKKNFPELISVGSDREITYDEVKTHHNKVKFRYENSDYAFNLNIFADPNQKTSPIVAPATPAAPKVESAKTVIENNFLHPTRVSLRDATDKTLEQYILGKRPTSEEDRKLYRGSELSVKLEEGQYLKLEGPIFMPQKRNDTDTIRIGNDNEIRYDELKGKQKFVYNAQRGMKKIEESYAFSITTEKVAKATPPIVSDASNTTQKKSEDIAPGARFGEEGPHGKAYTDVTVLAGTGHDQLTGNTPAGPIDPISSDVSQFKTNFQHYNKNSTVYFRFTGTRGNDGGSPMPTMQWQQQFLANRTAANSIQIGGDARLKKFGKAGVGIGADFQYTSVKTGNGPIGETSAQKQNIAAVRPTFIIGDFNGSHVVIGPEATFQFINEKAAIPFGYKARSTTEFTPAAMTKGRVFLGAQQKLLLDWDGRYGIAKTFNSTDGTDSKRSNFWNASFGIGYNPWKNFGLYGQFKFGHNEETYRGRSGTLGNFQRNFNTFAGGVRYTIGK